MREIEIVLDDGTVKKVTMKSVKGRHALQMWNKMNKLTNESNESDISAVLEYRNLLSGLAAELTGMSVDEIEDLAVEEKVKITKVIEEKTREEMGFSKPSST